MFTLNCKGKLVKIDQPRVMGILNITPDSFYPGSRFEGLDGLLVRAEQMIREGAAFLDIGGQSTRPGSETVGADEELRRVIPAIELVSKNFPESVISVDTYFSQVAVSGVESGASMVNDISGGTADSSMLHAVGGLHVPYICMHMRGTPQTMHQHTEYTDIITELLDFFSSTLNECRQAGIHDVIIDPGYGFSKNSVQNFTLMQRLALLKILGRPILAGISRKSTIYKTLGTGPEQALNGTTVLNTINLLNGADILRVHDVKEAIETIKLVEAYRA